LKQDILRYGSVKLRRSSLTFIMNVLLAKALYMFDMLSDYDYDLRGEKTIWEKGNLLLHGLQAV